MKKNKLILAALLSTVCVAASAGEYRATVNYPSFHCNIVDQSISDKIMHVFKDARVKFDTKNILLKGAAIGQPYVTTEGHIDAQPASIFDKYYFETERDGIKDGEVVITVSGVDEGKFNLICVEGHGDGLALYGSDAAA